MTPGVRRPSATGWAPVRVEVSSRCGGGGPRPHRRSRRRAPLGPRRRYWWSRPCCRCRRWRRRRPVRARRRAGSRRSRTVAVTSTGRRSWATRQTVAITAAAPAMSLFMSSMPAAGLIEMPPLSKVMAFPTSATCFAAPRAACSWSRSRRGLRAEPAPTARMPPSPRPPPSSSRISADRPSFLPAAAPRRRARRGRGRSVGC